MDVAKSTPRCRYSRACPTTLLAKMSPINNLSCRRFVVTKQEKPLNPYPEGTENGQTHERAAEKVTATVSVETGRGGGASREEHFEQSFEFMLLFFSDLNLVGHSRVLQTRLGVPCSYVPYALRYRHCLSVDEGPC